jgi:hypothetical protein
MKGTWRITKSLTNTNPNIPPLTINGKLRPQIKEKINSFGDTLEQFFTTNSDFDHTFIVGTEQAVNDYLKQPLADWVRPTNYLKLLVCLPPQTTQGCCTLRGTEYNTSIFAAASPQIYCQNI